MAEQGFPFPIRKIIHVDMDAFYASVEQLDNPTLKGKPLAVGGNEIRGVISAASYEARVFGVRSAMTGVMAKRLCPEIIFVPPRFDRYKEISIEIRKIFNEYTDFVEPLSLDEAFLDVTENKFGIDSASKIAKEIRTKISEKLGLNASAGISVNKFIAKIASDINKPNGQKTIPPEEVVEFVEKLKVSDFFGVGKVTAEKMRKLGIFKGEDLKRQSLLFLQNQFGKQGLHFYNISRGIQHSVVQSNRERKSFGAEYTFEKDITTLDEVEIELSRISVVLEKRTNKSETKGKTITLKVKYADFSVQTRSKTFPEFISESSETLPIVKELFEINMLQKPIRLLGISLSKLNTKKEAEENEQVYFYKTVQLSFPF